jgi:hypothetical protein
MIKYLVDPTCYYRGYYKERVFSMDISDFKSSTKLFRGSFVVLDIIHHNPLNYYVFEFQLTECHNVFVVIIYRSRRLSSRPVGFDSPGISILIEKVFEYIIFRILEAVGIEIEFISIRSEFRIVIT